ncbi:hypothetical protein [Streptomyces decoyicus]|uniref:hypothetical protein n=1 Tax=Streptomyces decoyicus TaxID=249567 RepID=UPI003663A6D2
MPESARPSAVHDMSAEHDTGVAHDMGIAHDTAVPHTRGGGPEGNPPGHRLNL